MSKFVCGEVALEVDPHQVAGKESKLLYQDRSKLLKMADQHELDFYMSVFGPQANSQLMHLRPLLPSFKGTLQLEGRFQIVLAKESEWLRHLAERYQSRNRNNSFIVLQNLTFGMKRPCVFDIKIGGNEKEHKGKQAGPLFAKLNGCLLPQPGAHQKWISKFYLKGIKEIQQITAYLALFLAEQDTIQQEALRGIKQRVQLILQAIKSTRGYRFISSSLIMIYDASEPARNDVRLIDFTKGKEKEPDFEDQESIVGVQNVLNCLQAIEENPLHYQQQLGRLRQKPTEAELQLIPQAKRVRGHVLQAI